MMQKLILLVLFLLCLYLSASDTVDVFVLDVPELTYQELTVPGLAHDALTCDTEYSSVDLSEISYIFPSIQTINALYFTAVDHADRLENDVAILKSVRSQMRDKRWLDYCSDIISTNENVSTWMDTYQSAEEYSIKSIPLTKAIRMIAEVRVPETTEQWNILADNLKFYKEQGYTSVLVTIELNNLNVSLQRLVSLIMAHDYAIWFTIGGKEAMQVSVLQSQQLLEKCMEQIAPFSEGMIIGWRRTSLHLFLMDKQYVDYLAHTARKYKASLYIVGETFYGETAETADKLVTNIPEYASACTIVGLGYYGVNIKNVINTLYKDITVGKLAVIVGRSPYYATYKYNSLNFSANLKVKQQLEERFIAAGCIGTITICGDGSDGIYGMDASDNLSTNRRIK